jgi:hypothetical protein
LEDDSSTQTSIDEGKHGFQLRWLAKFGEFVRSILLESRAGQTGYILVDFRGQGSKN